MAGQPQGDAAQIAALVRRMPHAPGAVAATMAEAIVAGRLAARGGPAALERFYAHLHAKGRPPRRQRRRTSPPPRPAAPG